MELYEDAINGDAEKANELQEITNELGRIYQKDRILSESLGALKVIMNELGLCGPAVLPPFIAADEAEQADIKKKFAETGISK